MTPRKKVNITIEEKLYSKIGDLLSRARKKVVTRVNQTMVFTYYEIGRIIVENEQGGKERAEYGKGVLKRLSKKLSKDFGRGFSTDNLENMRRFYLTYSKSEKLSRKSEMLNFQLSWSHYLKLVRIEEEDVYLDHLKYIKENKTIFIGIRDSVTLEELIKEQAHKGINEDEFDKLVDELNIQEPIEDLIAQLN